MKKLSIILLVSALVACGGGGDDDDDDNAGPDAAAGTPDAAAGTPDAAPVNCLATADYGSPTLGMQQGQFAGTAATPDFLSALGTINEDGMPDALGIELYKGSGAFGAGEIVPGTYNIEGAELNYATCGVCVRVFTDWSGSAFTDAGYFATGGTLTITSVSPTFEGSISNVTLQHVEVDGTTFESTPHADGCTTSITAASWSVTPEAL